MIRETLSLHKTSVKVCSLVLVYMELFLDVDFAQYALPVTVKFFIVEESTFCTENPRPGKRSCLSKGN